MGTLAAVRLPSEPLERLTRPRFSRLTDHISRYSISSNERYIAA
jgi:hypothetical protein